MNKKSGLADNPLFHNPALSAPESANGRTDAHPHPRTPERATARTGAREIVRRSYNVFADQHNQLMRLEAEAKLSGKPVAMSDLVRQALDQFFKRHR
jgi:hypothetical protein